MKEITTDVQLEAKLINSLLEKMSEDDWNKHTTFKDWTPAEVVAHLYYFDLMAIYSYKDKDKFQSEAEFLGTTGSLSTSYARAVAVKDRLGTKNSEDLRSQWFEVNQEMCKIFSTADPRDRMMWFGPDMGARMFITARFMEMWSHAQELYDLMNTTREYSDRIKHVATIGVKTFGWTYVNRGLEVPKDIPYVEIKAPSGEIWEWNEPNNNNFVKGLASDFCHVVTQGRNVKETKLEVVGKTASEWMSIAQCFAGGAEDPPAVGTRTN
tara:strand:- start:604 stop:1404 length:801 start_codon:yes stop_codon:yes gene_type:complete